jgi:hypothetical protein
MNLKRLSFSLGVAGLLFSGCEQKQSGGSSTTNAQGSSGNPITAPVDYLGAAAKAKQSSQKVVANVGLSQAVKQFYAVEGRFPKDLNELVTKEYIPSLPSPPVGMKYQYNPSNGDLKTVVQ